MSTADDRGAGRVIVVGSINIDLVMRLPRLPIPGETVLGGALARHDGGKGANQAVAAARAGAPVHLIGAVGERDGEDSIRALEAEGVDVTYVLRREGATGHAVVLVDDVSGENQIAVAAGANSLLSAGDVAESLLALTLSPADVVVLSFELPVPPLRTAADLAARVGSSLVVNPAPAQAGHAGLLAGAITTPNAHELAGLMADPEVTGGLDPHAAALALARRTSAPVIVTMGADGALLADADATEHFPGRNVAAVDTTGAGDTLTGVLAAGLAMGYPLRVCVQRAVTAAGLAVTKAGAREGMPTAAAINEMLHAR
jgi:ribokinase